MINVMPEHQKISAEKVEFTCFPAATMPKQKKIQLTRKRFQRTSR
jgi:hypothetical protein